MGQRDQGHANQQGQAGRKAYEGQRPRTESAGPAGCRTAGADTFQNTSPAAPPPPRRAAPPPRWTPAPGKRLPVSEALYKFLSRRIRFTSIEARQEAREAPLSQHAFSRIASRIRLPYTAAIRRVTLAESPSARRAVPQKISRIWQRRASHCQTTWYTMYFFAWDRSPHQPFLNHAPLLPVPAPSAGTSSPGFRVLTRTKKYRRWQTQTTARQTRPAGTALIRINPIAITAVTRTRNGQLGLHSHSPLPHEALQVLLIQLCSQKPGVQLLRAFGKAEHRRQIKRHGRDTWRSPATPTRMIRRGLKPPFQDRL